MNMNIEEIRTRMQGIANKEIAEQSKRYLKSPYSFYGIRVPELRKIAKEFKENDIYEAYNLFDKLWYSGNHEEMSLGIFILQNQRKSLERNFLGSKNLKNEDFCSYRKSYDIETWNFIMKKIDNAVSWDHIDYISSDILSRILLNKPELQNEVKEMALSKNPWIRRSSIVSTYQLIKNNKIELTFRLAEKLVYDENIYVQKGAGWMLREAGKRQRIAVKDFILMHLNMKASAFSYATEKMKELRKMRKEKIKGKKENEN